MRARRPGRLKTFSYTGKHQYFVTRTTEARQKLFSSAEVVVALTDHILRTCDERCFKVLAYVFMEDHIHLLIEGECEDAHLVPMMTLLRQRTTIAYRRMRNGKLWQDGYYERVLRPSDDAFALIQYIRDNPTAAALPTERAHFPYVWWSSNVLGDTRSAPL